MTPDIATLRRLLEGTSEAPWEWLDGDDSDPENPGDELQDGRGEMVATGFRDQYLRDKVTDGRLAAAARNALPALLARVEELEYLADAALTGFIFQHGSDFDEVTWPEFAALRTALESSR
jgi:hypothetical protein